MREIKFRGQTRRKGEYLVNIAGDKCDSNWVYGGIFPQNEDEKGFAVIYQQEPEIKKYTVYADTVGQYTGLKDKNGKEIYDGDIVECRARKDGYDKYKVVWCKDYADFRIEPLDFGVQFPIADYEGEYIQGEKYSIIGNIFDNPELLGGDTD